MSPAPTRLAMATAAVMLAHQVASKAFRDAAFLSDWPATALPAMIIATSAVVVLLVPLFSRLLDRFAPVTVVAAGFLASAAGHGAEYAFFDNGRWIVVVIYLHLAGASALLLSGFWSLVDERFDPASARKGFGRIAAAGTAGGVAGSVAAERIASMLDPSSVLLLLLVLHVACAAGSIAIGGTPPLFEHQPGERRAPSGMRTVLSTPYLRVIAGIVVLTTAGSAMLDYLLKSQASEILVTERGLLRFFAGFYAGVHVLSFLSQAGTAAAVRRLGIGRTISTLPAAVSGTAAAAVVVGSWPAVIVVRGLDAVLRGSLFRSGYELLFVPMDPAERRRVKTVIDVTCDRAGEAAGAGIVQALLAVLPMIGGWLMAIVAAVGAVSYWLARRLDQLYLGVVEQELLKRRDTPQVALMSEAGWTIMQLGTDAAVAAAAIPPPSAAPTVMPRLSPELELLAQLKSGSRATVEQALTRTGEFRRVHVAQAIDLLAWDEVVQAARRALETLAPDHVGMFVDALLDPDTDFAIRRRVPRILGTVPTERSLEGVVRGLDDARFEVRYHCSRAMDRLIARNPDLQVDRARILAAVDRELSVSAHVWQGYRLLDRPDADEQGDSPDDRPKITDRNVEHVFALLATIVAREPLDAAMQGIGSPDAGVRGLAVEYLAQVLPSALLAKLRLMIDARDAAADGSTPSSGDAPGQSGQPPTATRP